MRLAPEAGQRGCLCIPPREPERVYLTKESVAPCRGGRLHTDDPFNEGTETETFRLRTRLSIIDPTFELGKRATFRPRPRGDIGQLGLLQRESANAVGCWLK